MIATFAAALFGSALALFAPASTGSTDRLPQQVDRDDVLRLVRERSPALATAAAQIEVVRADEVGAAVVPNPELRYMGYGRVFGSSSAINGQQHQVELALPVLIAGQRKTRRRAAAAMTRVAEADACVVAHAVAGEALDAFVQLLAGQERLAVLEAGEHALAITEELTQARAGLGAQTQYDALRITTERETFAVELSDARSAVVDAGARLAGIVGAPTWRPTAVGSLEALELDGAPVDASPVWRTHGPYVPVVVAAARGEDAAAAMWRAAKRERWPVPTLSFGSYVTTDGTSGSLVASIELPLPIFDRGQGAMARARAAQRVAAVRRTEVERAARTELERALDVLQVRRESAAAFRRSALARAPELRAMAQEAYRGGASNVIELLDAERAWLDVQLRWIDLLERLALARIDVEVAAGTLARQACR